MLEFLEIVFDLAGLDDPMQYVEIDPRFYRPQEVPYLLGDSSKARKVLKWKPKTDLVKLADIMLQHDIDEISKTLVPGL